METGSTLTASATSSFNRLRDATTLRRTLVRLLVRDEQQTLVTSHGKSDDVHGWRSPTMTSDLLFTPRRPDAVPSNYINDMDIIHGAYIMSGKFPRAEVYQERTSKAGSAHKRRGALTFAKSASDGRARQRSSTQSAHSLQLVARR